MVTSGAQCTSIIGFCRTFCKILSTNTSLGRRVQWIVITGEGGAICSSKVVVYYMDSPSLSSISIWPTQGWSSLFQNYRCQEVRLSRTSKWPGLQQPLSQNSLQTIQTSHQIYEVSLSWAAKWPLTNSLFKCRSPRSFHPLSQNSLLIIAQLNWKANMFTEVYL